MAFIVEAIGIIAALIVIVALQCKDIRKLRRFNLVGSAMYLVYGLLLYSPSLILLNIFAIIINVRAMKELR